jgi:hypothetical protein
MKIEVFCFSSLTLSAVQDAELPQTKASKAAKGCQRPSKNTANANNLQQKLHPRLQKNYKQAKKI